MEPHFIVANKLEHCSLPLGHFGLTIFQNRQSTIQHTVNTTPLLDQEVLQLTMRILFRRCPTLKSSHPDCWILTLDKRNSDIEHLFFFNLRDGGVGTFVRGILIKLHNGWEFAMTRDVEFE